MMMIVKNIDNIVLIIGVLSTISCVLWCMWEYSLDLDLSQVDHKNFGEEENFIMPSFSLCFANPFLADNLKHYGFNITIENYLDFLVGKYYDERMLKIDFENVTKDLDDYISAFSFMDNKMRDDSIQTFFDINSLPLDFKKPYLSYTGIQFGLFHKCYSVNIPYNVMTISLTIKESIFMNNIRPNILGFSLLIHYPHQVLHAFETFKNDWPNRKDKPNKPYIMLIKITSLEVIKRRNTGRHTCNENWRNDYFEVLERLIQKNKCRAPYQTLNPGHPICNDREKMSTANVNITDKTMFPPPCQHIEKISYDYDEYDTEDLDTDSPFSKVYLSKISINNTFTIAVGLLNSKFKLITHKKAYDFQTLIGNCGGYIGLILGKYVNSFMYSNIQLLSMMLIKMKNIIYFDACLC